MEDHSKLRAAAGDRNVIKGHYIGEHERDGEIIELLGHEGEPPYFVRWDDGHISEFFPTSDAYVEHFAHDD